MSEPPDIVTSRSDFAFTFNEEDTTLDFVTTFSYDAYDEPPLGISLELDCNKEE